MQVEEIYMDINLAIPCGMILNELITNALIHAFPHQKEGTIRIYISHYEYKNVLTVWDNGVGIPNYDEISQPESLGFQLVSTLVDQIDGSISIESKHGTKISIDLPLE